MDRLRRGVSAYAAMIRLFSRNVWLVLLFGIGSGLTFGVFLFTFNFYVLSLGAGYDEAFLGTCLLYTSPSPRDRTRSRMPSSA